MRPKMAAEILQRGLSGIKRNVTQHHMKYGIIKRTAFIGAHVVSSRLAGFLSPPRLLSSPSELNQKWENALLKHPPQIVTYKSTEFHRRSCLLFVQTQLQALHRHALSMKVFINLIRTSKCDIWPPLVPTKHDLIVSTGDGSPSKPPDT